jgi:alpha-beta hydrolase superfamily lysophospholipase
MDSDTFTAGDGYRWHFRHYPATGEERALVVGLHGIQSHGGWYTHSCQRLAAEGFPVWFLDRRGSGLNEQARGDAPSFRRLLDDITEFLHPLRQQHPGKKVLLCAISWGGKLAAALPTRHPGLVDGLALLCPGFCPRIRPPLGQRLRIFLSRWLRPTRLFPIPLNDPELFTATPHWLECLRQDPLALHQATARLLFESLRLDVYLWRTAHKLALPVLLQLAGRDRIIDNARTRSFVGRFAGEACILEYPEAHHTLEFEPDPEVWMGDLLRWLGEQAGG